MRKQELQLRIGWQINADTGVCMQTSDSSMSTFLLIPVYKGSILNFNTGVYEYKVYYFTKDVPEEYVYTYSYQNEQHWAGYQRNEFTDIWIKGKTVFETDGYIRLEVQRCDKKNLTKQDIDIVANLLFFEHPVVTPMGYLERADVKKELEKTIDTIEKTRTDDSLVFTLLTDTHYVVNGNWENTLETIQAVNKVIRPDGIIHLGDLADGILDKDLCAYYSYEVIDGLKKMELPFYLTIGNHDTNYFANNPNRLNEEEQYSLFLENIVDGECGENQLWYYKDFFQHKLRVLFLHSFDASAKVRYGFPIEEVVWVRKRLEELPEEWQVVIFSHEAPIARLDYWASDIRNGETLTVYLEEWNRTHGERILAYIHGHTHADYIYKKRAFPIVSIGCSKCEFFPDKKPEGATRYRREMENVRETLWDTMIIQPKKKKIDFIRFGAGEDRCIENKEEDDGRKMTQIWAHRGASAYAPENTMEAFKLALQLGADGIELDVQFTKDRELVVIHDEKVDRTSDGKGRVVDYTLEELKKMNFNKIHPEYDIAKIPTLREVLEFVKPSKMVINIELKTGINFYDGIEKAVISLVEEFEMQDRVIYSSFNHQSVLRVKELRPNAMVGFLYSDGIYNVVDYAKLYGVKALHPSLNNMQYEGLVEACKENEMKLHVWTVNKKADMQMLIDRKVDAIITNYPDVAYAALHGAQKE